MEHRTSSYLQLIKPGITLSNTLSGVAGFFLATSLVGFSFSVLIGSTLGIALIIASACVANNILDRDIDRRMKRTKKRDVANGKISITKATMFSIVLGLAGFAFLLVLTNVLTFLLGVLAYIWYVVIYAIAKRTTPLSTVIGAVAGALPPMAGYTALTGRVDTAAILLFLFLFFWQLPHFYAIAMFNKADYAKANIPVWSVKYGLKSTKLQIFISVVLYAVVASLLTIFGYTGIIYLVLSSALSLYWIYKGVSLYNKVDDVKWAKMMFGVSLLVLLSMLTLISIGGYLA
ncbi:MAG: heme o synthase [Candidatus Saccharimonadaceae bacterium]